ncbi:MAG TPA: hypothetical protein VKR80_07480 [Candidatus Limnocylindria bacterium]|nr:hypothetical protein [Candidatus Limnocylindria bacterium]
MPGSLTDLDPPPAPERRWPFYVLWVVGGVAVAAVLFTHLPVSLSRGPAVTEPPAATALPVLPVRPAFRVAPLPAVPARP